jgi:hypothetical protein
VGSASHQLLVLAFEYDTYHIPLSEAAPKEPRMKMANTIDPWARTSSIQAAFSAVPFDS